MIKLNVGHRYRAGGSDPGLRRGEIADMIGHAVACPSSMGKAAGYGFNLAALLFGLMCVTGAYAGVAKPGSELQDCSACPMMVVIPAGSFVMGSSEDERERASDEGPQHRVSIARPFAVGKYEVTFEEWDVCVAEGGCAKAGDFGFGRGKQPVIDVSWDDAKGYAGWLSVKTRQRYRLLTEAEWEYAARAGTTTRYYFGNFIGNNQANCDGCGSRWDDKQTAPVGSFPPNAFGLYDMMGNVWEWVEDGYQENYKGAPSDGSAREGGVARVLRGGAWNSKPQNVRSAKRLMSTPDFRDGDDGFRVARDIEK